MVTDVKTTNEIHAMLEEAARSAKRSPSLRFQGVGDGFTGTVTGSSIRDLRAFDPDKPPTKTLIVELAFDADRTQTTKRTNASTGFVEEVEVKGTDWTWFVREGSQALFELSRAVKDGGGGPGSPWPGDQISAKLVGFKPSPKGPDPMQVIEVGFTAGSKSRDLVDRDEES
jgi:hypothetical protein